MGITINGKTIITNGGSIQVGNGKIIIDGLDMTPDCNSLAPFLFDEQAKEYYWNKRKQEHAKL